MPGSSGVLKAGVGLGASAALLLTGLAAPAHAAAAPITLSIASFNDFHGNLSDARTATKFAAAVQAWRAKDPEGSILTSAGDSVGGSKYPSSIQQDTPTLKILNALGVKASAAGNHEYDKGAADLAGRISDTADFPYLAANVIDTATGKSALPGTATFTVKGVKVAVVGAVTSELPTLVSPSGLSGLRVEDPVEALNREVKALPADVDVVIASYHEGAADGSSLAVAKESVGFKDIAEKTDPRVNVIFNGHTHREYSFSTGGGDGKRPVLQAFESGQRLGTVDLSVDPETRAVTVGAQSVVTVPQDIDVNAAAAADPVVASVKKIEDEALATAAQLGDGEAAQLKGDLTTDYYPNGVGKAGGDRSQESTLGNFAATALAHSVNAEDPSKVIGFMNAGGLRDEFFTKRTGRAATSDDKVAAGTVGRLSVKEVYNVFPFANTLSRLTLKGSSLKAVLEQQWRKDASGTEVKLALGTTKNLSYSYDLTRPVGDRVTAVTVNGAPLDPAATYTVATQSFLAGGGDAFAGFTEATSNQNLGGIDFDALLAYVKASSPLTPDYSTRGVGLQGVPAAVEPDKQYTFTVQHPDLGSDGVPETDALKLVLVPTTGAERVLASAPVSHVKDATGRLTGENSATVTFTAPADLTAGRLELRSAATGTAVRLPSSVVPAVPAQELSIAQIQGTGSATAYAGKKVSTTGVVTATYATGGFNGYYLQTPGKPGRHEKASRAVFVYSKDTVGQVKIGDTVKVTGTAGEYFGLTQITVPAGGATVLPAQGTVKPLKLSWPRTAEERERYEGMLVSPRGEYTVADNYKLNQYGEITLATGTSKLVKGVKTLSQPTDVARPGSARAAAVEAENLSRAVGLDDGSTLNFLGNAAAKATPLPYLSKATPVSVGATAKFNQPVILDWRNDTWKFQPTTHLTDANKAAVQPATFKQPKQAAPSVRGDIKISSFNVLNFFTTTGDKVPGCTFYTDRAGSPITVKDGCTVRGAANDANRQRQEDKLVSAINALDVDVLSLEEIENGARFGTDRDATLARLVWGLNYAERSAPNKRGEWAWIPSIDNGPATEDAIRTAFIYRKGTVKPSEGPQLLHHAAFANAREPLAQVFEPVSSGKSKPSADQRFLAIVNHFKSKSYRAGDPIDEANKDKGDGQGAWNAARVEQAKALVAWAAKLQGENKVKNVFLLGDFNAYSQEDPIRVIADAGYTDQGALTRQSTYLFGGRTGSLDHVFTNASATKAAKDREVWNINSTESVGFEYSRFNNNVTDLYSKDARRSSDHDPLVVGFDLSRR